MNGEWSIDAFERELAFLLVDAGRKLNDACDARMKPLGLSRASWRVIAYVSRTPGITQVELAQSVECSRMAISSLLDRMQVKGLIERRDVPGDRRARAVFLTGDGRALVRRMNRRASEVLVRVFGSMAPSELARLGSMLASIKENAAEIGRTGTRT